MEHTRLQNGDVAPAIAGSSSSSDLNKPMQFLKRDEMNRFNEQMATSANKSAPENGTESQGTSLVTANKPPKYDRQVSENKTIRKLQAYEFC